MAATARGPAERFDLTGKVAVVTGGSRGIGARSPRAWRARGRTW